MSREQAFKDIPSCPELHPTPEQFSNFQTYIESVEKQYSNQYGMVKIVPPKEWKARQSDYEKTIDNQMILGPIEQNPQGKGGIYECLHLTKKSIPFGEFKKRSIKFDKVTEGRTEEMIEDLFWKSISFSPPLYGSDLEMSLFDSGVEWSLKDLKSILNDGLTSQIPGVNTPYLYIGSWKTLFAWHKEDLDLGAINFLHYGKPKFWYTIAKSDSEKLEKEAKFHFSESFSKCSQFLRHKTIVINPYYLVNKYLKNIKISKTAQNEGEFIVVFNGAYHHGFNWGYNIAEAVNYATVSWLKQFQESKLCHCSQNNVTINSQQFLDTLLENRPDLKNSQEIKEFKQHLNDKLKQEKAIIQKKDENKVLQLAKIKRRGRKSKINEGQQQNTQEQQQPSVQRKSMKQELDMNFIIEKGTEKAGTKPQFLVKKAISKNK